MFKKILSAWKRLSYAVGLFNSRVILTLFYFLFLWPFSLVVRIMNPLNLDTVNESNWQKIEYYTETLEKAKEQ